MYKLRALTLASLLTIVVTVGCSSSDQGAIDKAVSSTMEAERANLAPTATFTPEPTAVPTPTSEPTAVPTPTPEPTPVPTPTPEPDGSKSIDKLLDFLDQANAEREAWLDKLPKKWNTEIVTQLAKESLDEFRKIKIAVVGMEHPSQCTQYRDLILKKIELSEEFIRSGYVANNEAQALRILEVWTAKFALEEPARATSEMIALQECVGKKVSTATAVPILTPTLTPTARAVPIATAVPTLTPTPEPTATVFYRVVPSDSIYTINDLKEIEAEIVREYGVDLLPEATSALKAVYNNIDYEVRFYATHKDAVKYGTLYADSVTGDDAVVAGDEVLWEEGRKDRRKCAGKGGHHSGKCDIPKYPEYVIRGNIILLCEGDDSSDAFKNCETLWRVVKSVGPPPTPTPGVAH